MLRKSFLDKQEQITACSYRICLCKKRNWKIDKNLVPQPLVPQIEIVRWAYFFKLQLCFSLPACSRTKLLLLQGTRPAPHCHMPHRPRPAALGSQGEAQPKVQKLRVHGKFSKIFNIFSCGEREARPKVYL